MRGEDTTRDQNNVRGGLETSPRHDTKPGEQKELTTYDRHTQD